MLRTFGLCFVCSVVVASGCGKQPPASGDAPTQKPTTRAAVKLNVVVIDDEKLAAGIQLLRGEWSERSGGEIELTEMSSAELLASEKISADLIIYPSRYVGTFVDRNWLRPIRDSLITNENFDFGDLLPLIRNRTLRLGDQYFALSLGEPPLMLACPEDALPEQGLGRWTDIKGAIPVRTSQLQFRRAIELLVRGIAYVPLKDDAAVLFDLQSMEPRISEPPFEKALSELLLIKRNENTNDDEETIGFAWPTSHSYQVDETGTKTVEFLPLPSAKETYHASREIWEPREVQQPTTMIGFSGRSVSVLRASRNSASAFKLLLWLTTGEPAIQLSQRSEGTVWFRESQVSQAQKWLAGKNAGEQTAATVTQLLSSENCYLLPRIPGIDEYLQALDSEIRQAVASETTAEKVLASVTVKWKAITEKIGIERQRKAYRRHLGFADFDE